MVRELLVESEPDRAGVLVEDPSARGVIKEHFSESFANVRARNVEGGNEYRFATIRLQP